ncbi:uncharacterized protein Tco025E_00819 [Trypanosoma conorhini]|uniref:J domain-containing protein n=1 Tax=Trypanosoma conorhini TaxID=83891 RepID=A0A3R7LGQ3_9TRYP|nr:uncharacterized protein Tco025E_00819 [Trypanosoma conorhini]RNF26953.1 hypothetical protein Tco025E_00819 [Trypanosoma conorhini]
MEAVAKSYFNSGDMKAAATFYCNLMVLHPRYVRMARICRVLADPAAVPQPHRYADIVEALLDPAITHEALFGGAADPADVNKAFQRWTLLVHPDKNPYPRAGDAFKRLFSLKTLALEVANEAKEKAGHAGSPHVGGKHGGGGPDGRSEDPAVPNRHGANASTAAKASVIDATLSEMKKRQVTLKSLKRKDIDDSDLPKLRTTLRGVQERRFCSTPPTPLASTEPCMPAHFLSPDQSVSSDGLPALHLHLPHPVVDRQTSPAPSLLPKGNTLFGTASVDEDALHGSSTASSSQGVPSVTAVTEQLEQILTEEDPLGHQQAAHNIGAEVPPTTDVNTANGVIGTQGTGSGIVCAPELGVVSPSPPTSVAHEGVSFTDAVKGSIVELMRGIQAVRINRAPLRLNCDLTFATYERERLRKMEAEVKKSLAE